MIGLADLVDAALELPIVPSYTRLGPAIRRRLDHWTPLDSYDLHDRVVVITGATSGLGLAAARQLSQLGAELVIVGRNQAKLEAVRSEVDADGEVPVHLVVADMSDLDQVRQAGETIVASFPKIDVLVHNAGALSADHQMSPDGIEITIAAQVDGPFLLTSLLLERLQSSAPARVLTMSSGGMYSQPLYVDRLEMPAGDYRGSIAYARAKRAQVTLNEMWAERFAHTGIKFHALHPGWADTPGVRESLPTFRRIVGPLLRSPADGADTLIWLAADDGAPLETNGRFWLDRRVRPIHLLPTTRAGDTPEQRERLWERCVARTGTAPCGTFGTRLDEPGGR
jgi:dehydrogenase/reductase SDR family member 12